MKLRNSMAKILVGGTVHSALRSLGVRASMLVTVLARLAGVTNSKRHILSSRGRCEKISVSLVGLSQVFRPLVESSSVPIPHSQSGRRGRSNEPFAIDVHGKILLDTTLSSNAVM